MMPRNFLPAGLAALALAGATLVLFPANSNGRAFSANQGNTGAPGEAGGTCGSCHGGGAFGPVSGSLAVTDAGGDPVAAWEAGETYDLTLTVAASGNPAGYGFQLTALDGTAQEAGTLAAGSANTRVATAGLVDDRVYAEHAGASATNAFTVAWTAPTAGTGTVTFHFCGNAVNGNGASSADNAMPASSFSLPEAGAPTGLASLWPSDLGVYPNPVRDGAVTLRGTWAPDALPDAALLDASGRVLRRWEAVTGGQRLELGELPAGPAFLRLSAAEGSRTLPLWVAP
jgi:hypothetical protein